MYEINLNPSRPGIDEWRNLGSSRNLHGVWIPEEGVEGFSSEPEAISTETPAIPGQITHGMDYPPISGTLTLRILPEHQNVTSLQDVYRAFVDSFHPLYETHMEVVRVEGDNRVRRTMPVRLSKPIPAPSTSGHQNLRNTVGLTHYIEMEMELIGDRGYWNGTGEISVPSDSGIILNQGDLPVYVGLGVTPGSSGKVRVTSPSGSSAVLTGTPGSMLSIGLDPQKLFIHETVQGPDGFQEDRFDLFPELTVISEQVPPWIHEGASGGYPRYSVSPVDGGTTPEIIVQYEQRFLTPWG